MLDARAEVWAEASATAGAEVLPAAEADVHGVRAEIIASVTTGFTEISSHFEKVSLMDL